MRKYNVYIIIITVLLFGVISNASAKIELPVSLLDRPILLAGDDDDNKANLKLARKKGKSTTKAVFLSLLLPGAGQLYLGEKGRAEFFIGVEILAWGGFAAFQTTGAWKRDDYIRFAERYAGIDSDGKNDEFYKNLSFYDSREQYNSSGRIIDPGGPYYPSNPEYYWHWDSEQSRLDYRQMRNNSKNDFRKAVFMVGVAVANRILASIDTYRIARKIKSQLSGSDLAKADEEKIKLNINANPFGDNPEINLTLSRLF
jgi:hypothetical protein